MPRTSAVARPALVTGQKRVRAARRVLAARGMNECVTWSFLDSARAELFGGGGADLKLSNPISSELTDMRPSLLPNLIDAARRNTARGLDDFGLFEVGPSYADDTPDGQATVAGGLRRGQNGPRNWLRPPRDVDAFDAKADALAVIAALGGPAERATVTTDAPGWYHPGRSGTIRLGPKTVLAYFGEVHPGVLSEMDSEGPMVGFEIFVDAIPLPRNKGSRARPVLEVSDLPAVMRDFAFLVDADVAAGKVLGAVRGLSGKGPFKLKFTAVDLFDVYTGTGVPDGKKSVALSVTIQADDKTLTEDEIGQVAGAIVAKVVSATGGELRG
jgi:phenylalanyl-tRNA synthetase beta chain